LRRWHRVILILKVLLSDKVLASYKLGLYNDDKNYIMATLREYIRKGSVIFFVDFRLDGKRCRISTRTSDRKQAELILKRIEVDIANGTFGYETHRQREMNLSGFIDNYLQYSKANKAFNTYLLDRHSLRSFRTFVGDVRLDRITTEDIESYKVKRSSEVKPTSLNIEIRHLKAAFETAVRWGRNQKNPFQGIRQIKIKDSNFRKYIEKEDVRVLLEIIPEGRFKDLVTFYLYTGSRRNEALNLKWDDIDLERGEVTFRKTKSGNSRIVPFNGILTVLFNRMEKEGNGPFNFRGDFVTHKFKKYLRSSGIDKDDSLNLHSLRHTFASHLVMAGIDLKTVSVLLGHSSVRVTEMYAHLAPNHMKSTIEQLVY